MPRAVAVMVERLDGADPARGREARLGGHTSSNGRLLTPDELAERWRVKRSQVYRLTRDGAIPAVRVGRYYRYRLDAIEAYERGGSDA